MIERLNAWRRIRAASPGGMGIRGRLFVGFGLVLACLGGITALSYATLERTVGDIQRSAESQAALAATTAEMARRVCEANIALLAATIAADPEDGKDRHDEGLRAFKDYDAAQARLDSLMARTPEFQPLKAQVEVLREEASGTRLTLNSMIDRVGDPAQRETVGAWMSDAAQPDFRMWAKRLTDLDALRSKTAIAQASQVQASSRSAAAVLLAVAGIAFAIGLGAAWIISQGVVGPIRRAVTMSRRVAQGDLAYAIEAGEGGEVGALLDSLSQMQDGLRTLVRDVQRSTDGMAVASGEVAMGNQDLSVRTEQTAAELQRTAQSIQQLSQTVSRTADAAQTANQLAGSTSQAAQRGSDAISQVVVSMTTISSASSKISEITSVIDGIAFQTNILALNAAVEAARAGEQGRGFAVVASEVRALAQRSAKAAREIKTLIDANVSTVGTGEQQVSGAVDEMRRIFDGVRQVSEVIADISLQTSNQAGELAQVTGAVGRVDAMTQQNAALVEQGAAAAESLREEAVRLKQSVGNFQLDDAAGAC